MMSEAMTAATFSLESEAGNSPSSSPGGKGRSGPGAAHASRSASPAKAQGKRTPDTCGPLFTASSPSADLQRCLASRLQGLTDVNGSLEFALIWKDQDMPWGPPICALRASARRTSGSVFGGWPTPQRHDAQGGKTPEQVAAMRTKGHGVSNLNEYAHLAGWPTPMTKDKHESARRSIALLSWHEAPTEKGKYLAGWRTPDAVSGHTRGLPASNLEKRLAKGHQLALADQASMTGTRGVPPSTPTATTGERGALAPEFSRWLMGYPEGWESFADSATPSSRK